MRLTLLFIYASCAATATILPSSLVDTTEQRALAVTQQLTEQVVAENGQLNVEAARRLLNIFAGRGEVAVPETRGDQSKFCDACALAAKVVGDLLNASPAAADVGLDLLTGLCMSNEKSSERVCREGTETMKDHYYYVLLPAIPKYPYAVCGALSSLAGMYSCAAVDHPYLSEDSQWKLNIPDGKPPVADWPQPSGNSAKVLWLSDVHLDPHYKEGSILDCGEPVCCRPDSAPKDFNKTGDVSRASAGYWGEFQDCDTPVHTFDDMLRHIRETESQVDWIYLLGDLVPHDSWNSNTTEYLEIMDTTFALISKHFPGIPIFGNIGNHDVIPLDQFPPNDMPEYDEFNQLTHWANATWLYSRLTATWTQYFEGQTVDSRTIQDGLYYSVKIPQTGLKIISINDNFCNDKNVWLLYKHEDPQNELQWLIDELLASEAAGESVHILAHIPTGDHSCLKAWSSNYYDIVNRFESTIRHQFNGHIHKDYFIMYYDTENYKRPVSFAFVGPPATPWAYTYMGYRMYDIDTNNGIVLDHTTHYIDLVEAQQHYEAGEPTAPWKKEYNFKELYGVSDFSPQTYDNLIRSFQTNQTLFQQFEDLYWISRPGNRPCATLCRDNRLCKLVEGKSYDAKLCPRILRDAPDDPQKCSNKF